MITDYIAKKLKEANYKLLEDGSYFGEIPGLQGVWASANSLEATRTDLQEVLEDWLLLKVKTDERIPGFNFKIKEYQLAMYA